MKQNRELVWILACVGLAAGACGGEEPPPPPVTRAQPAATASPGDISVTIEASKQNDNANLNLRVLAFNFEMGQYDDAMKDFN